MVAQQVASRDLLADAVRALAGRCDYGYSLDNKGFNRLDAQFGHSLAERDSDYWTLAQRKAAYKMIAKYRGQLSRYGIDYAAIPNPETEYHAKVSLKRVDVLPQHRVELLDKSTVRIIYPYSTSINHALKSTVERSRWNPAYKCWTAPIADSDQLAVFLREHLQFSVAPEVTTAIETRVRELETAAAARDELVAASKAAESDFHVSGLSRVLRPYQRAGVAYAVRQKRVFIADEMGLGKTVQAIATYGHVRNSDPKARLLVVCPNSLKLNWEREVNAWIPKLNIDVVSGGKAQRFYGDVVIINYDVLYKHVDAIRQFGPRVVVFDEGQYVKNNKATWEIDPATGKKTKRVPVTRRVAAAEEVAVGVEYRLVLTGTPVTNAPWEIVEQLIILDQIKEFGGITKFLTEWCGAQVGGWGGYTFTPNQKKLAALHLALRERCFIRRLKSEVLPDLPAKQRTYLPLPLTNHKEYSSAEADVIAYLAEVAGDEKARRATRAEQLVKIEVLKQLSAKGKREAVLEWVSDFLEDSDQKLIIFAQHREEQVALLDAVRRLGDKQGWTAARIFSEDKPEERQRNVDRFQQDSRCRVIVCSLVAGGVGITLTAASNVAFVEFGWNPAAHDQAEDRAHRIGQTADSVNVYYLVGENTIDEAICQLIDDKRAVVDALTDGRVTAEEVSVIDGVIDSLLHR